MAAAASLGLAALGWVASPIAKDLITKSITYLGTDIAKGLEDLETILLPQFQLTIQAAKNSPHATELKKWLARLKNAYYDAEAILHELEYESLRRKVKGEQNKTGLRISSLPIIKPLAKATSKVNEKVSNMSPQKRTLLHRLNELKAIAAEAKTFRDLLKSTETENGNNTTSGNSLPITSSILPYKVFGRDGDRDRIINFLLDMEEKGSSSSSSAFSRSFSVVAITDIGGAGKTTLAQYVYNDERVEKHFGKRMWICLSQEMDVIKLTNKMIQCITNKPSKLTELSILQNNLINALESEPKGLLLVLDNFWPRDTKTAEEDKQWDDLLAPFNCIRAKFKIIVTSRSDKFPVPLLPTEHIKLSDLAAADFSSLFRYYAGLQISNPESQYDSYYTIGDSITNKLSKSPLAARVVGNELNKNKNIGFWQKTERNVDLSGTTDVLLWSYQLMDVHLQRCFLLFSVYPKGCWPSKVAMVPYWVALDLIHLASDGARTVEDVGDEYYGLMVANSIIQPVNGMYVIHDLFYDLAEKLSTEDCCIITDYSEKMNPPTTVQHVFLRATDEHWKEKLSRIRHLSNLRTLILDIQYFGDVSEIFTMISTYFRSLRVLAVQWKGLKTLPRVVGDLRNLRFLDVSHTSIEVLPDAVSQLYHLQFLILPNYVKILPAKLGNLIKLRRIVMSQRNGYSDDHIPPVPYLGRLTSLQHLPEFHVRKEIGYELQQLGCLREIGGSLRIVGLENVRDKNEAVAARLIDKPKLKKLVLVWTRPAESLALEVDVIKALQPPKNLERLIIDGYRGSVCPTWLHDGSALMYLQSIGFYNCNALEVLPLNFSQFRHCKELILMNLGALRELPAFPINLTKLSIICCPCLALLCKNELPLEVEDFRGIAVSRFLPFSNYPWKVVLHEEVKSFEQTGSVENCPEQLEIIKSAMNRDNMSSKQWGDVVGSAWWCCHQQRMNFISSGISKANKLILRVKLCILDIRYCCISDKALSDGLRDMVSLQKLCLVGIMTITTLPPTDVLQTLQSLRDLKIYSCWCLRLVGSLHALPHIQKLSVEGCWNLDMKNNDCALLPPTLHSIIIRSCIFSENIFHANLPFLQNVELTDCQVPYSLSFHHVNSLQTLRISCCSSLRSIKLCPVIGTLELMFLPNLDVQSILESWPCCQWLIISSSVILNKLLSSQNFVAPTSIVMRYCLEVISFEKSVHLQSINKLRFVGCKANNLPITLRDFSNLEKIVFEDCLKISELPELPSSVQWIKITNCPMLRERCQPNGPDWHKIRDIKNKWIE